jgi:hypothetical protein
VALNRKRESARKAFSKLPHEQKRIANVLIGRALMHVNFGMDDLCNGVDEAHHALLQHLCDVGEVANVTETEYSNLQEPLLHSSIPCLRRTLIASVGPYRMLSVEE